MKKIWSLSAVCTMVVVLLCGQSAFAFSDVNGIPEADKINALRDQGVIEGDDADAFAPARQLTYAEGVKLVVKGLRLTIDQKFIKEPKPSDCFTNVPDDRWYSEAFNTACHNGLPIPRDVDPNAGMTREQYAHLLIQAMLKTGDYAFIDLWVIIADEKDVNPDMMNSIQKLLILKAGTVDASGNFMPKAAITRAESAAWLNDVVAFVNKQREQPPADPATYDPAAKDPVTVTSDKLNDDVNKVTLSWGEKPNTGYRLQIESVVFQGEEAVVRYRELFPEPNARYAQVITVPKAVTYVDSRYKVKLEQASGGGTDSSRPSVHPINPDAQTGSGSTGADSNGAGPNIYHPLNPDAQTGSGSASSGSGTSTAPNMY